jgi:hypothetical protein
VLALLSAGRRINTLHRLLFLREWIIVTQGQAVDVMSMEMVSQEALNLRPISSSSSNSGEGHMLKLGYLEEESHMLMPGYLEEESRMLMLGYLEEESQMLMLGYLEELTRPRQQFC